MIIELIIILILFFFYCLGRILIRIDIHSVRRIHIRIDHLTFIILLKLLLFLLL